MARWGRVSFSLNLSRCFAIWSVPEKAVGPTTSRVPLRPFRTTSLRRFHSGYHQVGGLSPPSLPQPPFSGPKDLGLRRRQEAAITGPRHTNHIVY
ncbi:hypothetical protein D6C98_08905 [Aureobasidium pullulans]|uniref:Secreted protein n=1 Tax=Aureobasidium pullulans TaxID=5580 RepID=A0A4S8XA77_AURPU|nr:hypothetical protein D6D21_09595 [Aureobasidium pullulans]THX16466.1 hypothetical protein D6D13_01348 [Aureobasidium pullulans]THX91609.1 hypothetical protein D6D08_03015 [Aureobasidium pullulans]THY42466.1 hypothetical protein D6C98_08905 [Aureobasidium pullulans]THY81323.1 hypothetical protein D6C95_09155 [Aureobasidium pullulans]